MKSTHVLAGVVVGDIDRAAAWYTDVFGRPADRVPMPSCHEWTLGADVTVQVHQNAGAEPGHSSLAVVVGDLERTLEEIEGRAGFAEIQTVSEFVRTSTARDPDGNQLTLVEPLS